MPRVALDKTAPQFSLEDFTGKMVNLSGFTGNSNVLLVFNRGFT